ncbi:hypothetical protein BS47DRAFT_482425 [Hydnum rufescens UP504]|uniref:Uncharacterized protein n=1 Tax=Hydnum rufescens UP504 TaxID=1448309 RepID=A0A9P6AJC9_9AGAM|nr:hypothetical protein BS47DRAFT_482425 [Hydnum rufescens UP504]
MASKLFCATLYTKLDNGNNIVPFPYRQEQISRESRRAAKVVVIVTTTGPVPAMESRMIVGAYSPGPGAVHRSCGGNTAQRIYQVKKMRLPRKFDNDFEGPVMRCAVREMNGTSGGKRWGMICWPNRPDPGFTDCHVSALHKEEQSVVCMFSAVSVTFPSRLC